MTPAPPAAIPMTSPGFTPLTSSPPVVNPLATQNWTSGFTQFSAGPPVSNFSFVSADSKSAVTSNSAPSAIGQPTEDAWSGNHFNLK